MMKRKKEELCVCVCLCVRERERERVVLFLCLSLSLGGGERGCSSQESNLTAHFEAFDVYMLAAFNVSSIMING